MKKIFLWLAVAVSLVGCQVKLKPVPGQKPIVLVSIPPYISVVQALAGDTVEVRSAVSAGFDPHTSEITPSQAQMIQNCDMWIGIGEPYEKKLLASLREAKREVRVVQLNELIHLLSYSSDVNFVDACTDSNLPDRSAADHHFWLSPTSLIDQADRISEALSLMNPQHVALYRNNLSSYHDKLIALDKKLRKMLRPYHKKGIIVSHPFLGYFCHDYGLHQIAIECEGKSPRPQTLSRVLTLAKNYDVQCVFTSPQFNNKGALLVAEKMHYQTYEIDPLQIDPLATISQVANDITAPR